MLSISKLEQHNHLNNAFKSDQEQIDNNKSKQFNLSNNNLNENTKLSSRLNTSKNIFFKKYLNKNRFGHRRVDEHGQVKFEKIETNQLCASLQMGICFSVSRLTSEPERDVLMNDFTIIEITFFPSSGSNITPAHKFEDFKFKAYAPFAFRYFRDLFGIAPEDYLISVGHEELRELSNPGASGSVFYKTKDDRFIIKTVQQKESNFLRKLLPKYFMNLHQNPDTLLPKFYGLYCCVCGSNRVRVVVMNNLLPSKFPIHLKFDLKGSSYKRKAKKNEHNKECPTYKDLDFIEIHPTGIFLENDIYESIIKTIKRDCTVLKSFNIMDYSFLIGIHNFNYQEKLDKEILETKKISNELKEEKKTISKSINLKSNFEIKENQNENERLIHNLKNHSQFLSIELNQYNRYSHNYYLPPDVVSAKTANGENVLLFCGIIDILQSYEFGKFIEHSFKSIITAGNSISVTKPDFYATRFQDFLANKVFKINEKTEDKLDKKLHVCNLNYLKHRYQRTNLNHQLNMNFTNSQIFNQSMFSNSTETCENQSLNSFKISIRSASSHNNFNKILQEELFNRTNNLNLYKKMTKDKLFNRLEYLKSIDNNSNDYKLTHNEYNRRVAKIDETDLDNIET